MTPGVKAQPRVPRCGCCDGLGVVARCAHCDEPTCGTHLERITGADGSIDYWCTLCVEAVVSGLTAPAGEVA